MEPQDAERRLAAILSADVVGYSRLMAEDEADTVNRLTAHRTEITNLVEEHHGRVVDFTGDNFLAEFATATSALVCSFEIQRSVAERNDRLPAQQRMQFRVGIHVGEIRIEEQRIFGSGVNIAARLEGLAEPGGVCLSGAAHDQVRRLPGVAFEEIGEHRLKNIPDPVRVFRARPTSADSVARVPLGAERDASVAVLPFVSMSSDPEQEFFGDGMAEELINALTRIQGLRVIARTSAFSFKGTQADIATIGQRLGVSAIVDGSVRRSGDRLRITAQLVDVAGGHDLWSESYDRALKDVFDIQDEIAARIVRTIRPKLLPEGPLVPRGTANPEAYELYLRANERILRMDRWEIQTAIEMLRKATELDPDYPDAWARLGAAFAAMAFAIDSDPRWYLQADQAIERALALDANCAEAHLARARLVWTPGRGFQNHEALCSLEKCLALQPGSYDGRYWHSVVLSHVGLLEEAREQLSEARAAQPEDFMGLVMEANIAFSQGRLEDAAEWMERSLLAAPTHLFVQINTPAIRLYLDDLAGAESAIRRARALTGGAPILDACEALLWAKRGEPERAEQALVQALDDRPSLGHIHHTWHYAGAAYAVLGQPEQAAAQLRAAMTSGLPNLPAFSSDPHIAPHRDHPEMQRLFADLATEDARYRRDFGRVAQPPGPFGRLGQHDPREEETP
jgi:adenylate cyclase